jgi:hypothetical protein
MSCYYVKSFYVFLLTSNAVQLKRNKQSQKKGLTNGILCTNTVQTDGGHMCGVALQHF